MRSALTLTKCLFPLAGCSFLSKHVPAWNLTPPANLTAKCPDLDPVKPADMGELLQVAIETSMQYRDCATRHNELVDAIRS